MSEYEKIIAESLTKKSINYECQAVINIEDRPWGNKRPLQSDFYLPDKKLHVEVKGFMTLESMFKIGWLLNNLHKKTDTYYCLIQASEHLYMYDEVSAKTQADRKKQNLEIQINELITLAPAELNRRSIQRVEKFIQLWLSRYKEHDIPLFRASC